MTKNEIHYRRCLDPECSRYACVARQGYLEHIRILRQFVPTHIAKRLKRAEDAIEWIATKCSLASDPAAWPVAWKAWRQIKKPKSRTSAYVGKLS